MIASTPLDQLGRPAYPVAEASRLVGLPARKVRRWLRGYGYKHDHAVGLQPQVPRGGGTASPCASFLDLVDLLVVKWFLDHGVSLQRVRRALEEACDLLGAKHFTRQTFSTYGGSIFPRLQEEDSEDRGDAILEVMSGGQRVLAPAVRELVEQLDFEAPEGLASRWYPLGRNKPVVLDPMVSFGAPSIVGRGVKTINIHDLFVAEDKSLASVGSWWSLTDSEIQAAVEFERQLVGRRESWDDRNTMRVA